MNHRPFEFTYDFYTSLKCILLMYWVKYCEIYEWLQNRHFFLIYDRFSYREYIFVLKLMRLGLDQLNCV